MADVTLTPITRGMDNGAEAIDGNFNAVKTTLSAVASGPDKQTDTGWLDCTIVGGFKGSMRARYLNGIIYHDGFISSDYNPTSEVNMRVQAFVYPASIAAHVKGEGQYDRPFHITTADNATYITGYIKGGSQVGAWIWKQKGSGQWGFSSIVLPAVN